MAAAMMDVDQNYFCQSQGKYFYDDIAKRRLTTQRQVDFSATQAPATGPMTAPRSGARE
jgi:hypothetical protein